MNFVLDSSCLIYLGKIKILEKLKMIEGNKYVPQEVYNEVIQKGLEREEPEVNYIRSLIEKKELIVKNPEKKLENPGKLSGADIDVISLAKEINAIPIIDDDEARVVAEFYDLDYHGSIYMIIILVNKKIITKKEALAYIDEMTSLGFYLSNKIYKEIIEKLK